MIALLTLILGLLAGFWAKDVTTRLRDIYDTHKDAAEFRKAGVVRPQVSRVTKGQPIDLTSSTGGIRKPTPAEVEERRQTERAQTLQDNHR
jgi:hypothetical protein